MGIDFGKCENNFETFCNFCERIFDRDYWLQFRLRKNILKCGRKCSCLSKFCQRNDSFGKICLSTKVFFRILPSASRDIHFIVMLHPFSYEIHSKSFVLLHYKYRRLRFVKMQRIFTKIHQLCENLKIHSYFSLSESANMVWLALIICCGNESSSSSKQPSRFSKQVIADAKKTNLWLMFTAFR